VKGLPSTTQGTGPENGIFPQPRLKKTRAFENISHEGLMPIIIRTVWILFHIMGTLLKEMV